MLEDFLEIQEKLQPHLRNRDYTFIGPEDVNMFEFFAKKVTDLAPFKLFDNSIHRVLSDKKATFRAIAYLPKTSPLRIFVIIRPAKDYNVLFHLTVEEYCEKYDIVI